MNEDHVSYLSEIGTTKVARDRAHKMWSVVSNLFPAELQTIFVCDVINDDGVRSYTNLWLFTDKYFAECRNFIEDCHFDRTGYDQQLRWIDIQSIGYELDDQPADAASLRVEARLNDGLQMTFTAVRNNCSHLKALIAGPLSDLMQPR